MRRTTLIKKFLLNPKPANGPGHQDHFEMYHQEIDIDAYYQTLRESGLEVAEVGHAMYQGTSFPILQLDQHNSQSKTRLLVIAGVHGDESAASLAVLDLLADIQQNPGVYKEWSIRILAPVNPVGLANTSRYNEDGYDINRDFKTFKTTGARVQRDTIIDFNPTIVVSLHESPSSGFFMFSEGRLPTVIKDSITNSLSEHHVDLARKNYLGVRLHSGIWEKSPVIFFFQRLLGVHTLGSYVYKRKILAVTTESSYRGSDIDARKKPHLLVIRAIISTADYE